jgi:hypothetical protein
VKWAILAVVLILVAPNIAKQFSKEEQSKKPTRRGVMYRAVARFGSRVVFIAFVIALALLAVGAYYVVRYMV